MPIPPQQRSQKIIAKFHTTYFEEELTIMNQNQRRI